MKIWNRALKGAIFTGILASILTAGCGGIINVPASVQLRGVNAMANLPAATIGASGAPLLAAGAYTASGSYITFNSNPAMGFVLLNGAVQLTTATFDTTTADHFTAYASNTLATPHLILIPDDLTDPGAGNGRIKIVNLSPTASTVDVYITAPGADISATPPSLSNLTFETAQTTIRLAATLEVRVTSAGTKTVLVDYAFGALASGDIKTLLVLDASGGGSPEQIIALNDKS